jgi:uncharacterized membrane protein YsdA (DUF1294 family)
MFRTRQSGRAALEGGSGDWPGPFFTEQRMHWKGQHMRNIAILYLTIMNIVGLFAMGIDKAKAKKRAWRIPERTLFLISLLGGSAGTWLGMYLFRHKTKHWYFVVGIPAILILQLGLVALFLHFM